MLNITNSSDYLLKDRKNVILVPEPFSHNYERFLCEKYSNNVSKNTEVLTFKRISDRIFAEIGGFANNYINDSGRILAMYNAINTVFLSLKVYNSNKIEIITKILDTIDQFKMYKIGENDLLLASKDLSGTLKNKVLDLYYIYSAYNKITNNEIQDPRQELEFLCENFHKCTIYNDTHIYFDKFDGFTPQQYALIAKFLEKNINVTITLDVREQTDKLYDLSSTARDTLAQLQKMCKIHNFDINIDFKEEKHGKFDEITKNMFEFEQIDIKNDDVFMHVSTTLQNECMYVAGKIIDIVQNSDDIRFSDIIVTARNFDNYQEQLRVAFSRYNLPIFISGRDDITAKAPVKLILSALDVILGRYKSQNVFEYLKSPVIRRKYNSLCAFEDYILRWDIKYITKNLVFTANPSFSLKKTNDKENERLDKLNEFKNESLEKIFVLDASFKKCEKGADFIRELYNFCEQIKLGFRILNFECEDKAFEQQYRQLWDLIVDSFDQFFEISGNQRMNTEEFVKLYKTLISSYSVADIPSSIDNIIAGGFEHIIGEKCKILFVMGADADSLPCEIKESPILNDDDREQLENFDIEMAPYGNELIIREYELIDRIFNIASDGLYLSFCEVLSDNNTPSSIFKRIVDMTGAKITTDTSDNFDFMYKSKKTALEYLAINHKKTEIEKINDKILQDNVKNGLTQESIDAIYSKNLSPSRIDVQTSCHFRHFMQYGLKVKNRKLVKFNQAENGNFIHYILENILATKDVEKIDVAKTVDELIDVYIDEFFAQNMENDPKFAYILDRLKKNTTKIVKNIIDEVKASEFKPSKFELEIGEDASVKPLKVGDFNIVGKVDRVDICEQGNAKYLRIIDYKSGVKKLNLDTIYHGMNMQMFIYMLALEASGDSLGGAIPKGALYVPTKVPKISESTPISEAKVQETLKEKLKRSGMIVEDANIISKMEKNDPFVYLPIKLTTKGAYTKNTTIVTSNDKFDEIKKFVAKKIENITDDILTGDTAPNPYEYDGQSPCNYCEFTSSCGFFASYDEKREIEKMGDEKFWTKIKG